MAIPAIGGRCPEDVSASRSQLVAYAAMAATVLIWAGFALSVRAMGQSPLATADVALIRFGIPSLLLCGFLPSRWHVLRRVRLTDALMVLAGAGLPFFWIAAAGGAQTSTAHVSALIAGTVPLSVALFNAAMGKAWPGAKQAGGLAVIICGVVVLVAAQPHLAQGNIWRGSALLLAASLFWAAYTVGLRRTALDAVGCAMLLTVPSFLCLLVLVASGSVATRFGQFGWSDALPFIAIQGIGVGMIASMTYAVAIARLGPARSAVFGSLAPALATLGAVPLLGEALTLPIAAGVAVITLGVILSNRS